MKEFDFDFMSKRRIALGLSLVLLSVSIGSFFVQGMNLGLDFTGGSLVEIGFESEIETELVRDHLVDAGFENGTVQYFGSNRDLLIRVPPTIGQEGAQLSDQIYSSISERFPGASLRQASFVGPAVGDELAEDGGLALLAALIVVMIYILFRFTKLFSIGAVTALAHDVVIVLGVFSFFQWTFDLTVLAALLAVIGYSLNDTIVVSDRIRENFRRLAKRSALDTVNKSLNQTLGRTLVTSLTTLFVLVSLLIFGGEVIRGFASALTIGVVIGTYSSIYVAASVLLRLGIKREDLLVPETEEVVL
jgi:preprotein translocase subunit SecF